MHAILLMAAAAAAMASLQPSDGYHYETITLTPRVHVIQRPDPVRVPAEGNITVIEQADGLVVVDAGGSPLGGRRVVEKIKAFSKKPVKFVIFTHWHGDHHLGAPAFRIAYPHVRFVSTEPTRADMATVATKFYRDYERRFLPTGPYAQKKANDPATPPDQKQRWQQLAIDAPLISKAYSGTKVVPADVTFTDKLLLDDADAPVQVMFLGRGNTDGDAVIWLPKQKVLIAGDLVVAPYPFGTQSYPKEWIDVLKKLEGYDFTWLVPGHGAIEKDRSYVDSVVALIEDVRAQVGPLAAQGLSLDDVKKKVDFEPEYQRFAGNDTFVRNFFKQFFFDSMIECAYKEAKGEPIVQE